MIPLFLSAFYMSLFPFGTLIAAAGTYFNHILTVSQWLTINKKPQELSPRIAKHFVNSLILIPLLAFAGAVVQMLEDKRKSTKDGPAMASIENELRATARQGFLQMAAQQINRTLYNREE